MEITIRNEWDRTSQGYVGREPIIEMDGDSAAGIMARRDEAIRRRDATDLIIELRAILAPALANPWRHIADDDVYVCVFCGESDIADTFGVGDSPHFPTCPVLRKDELLGHQ